MSFSMLYFSKAWVAQSTASWNQEMNSSGFTFTFIILDLHLLHLLGHVRILDHCLPVRHAGGAEDGVVEDQKEFKGSGNSPWAGLGGRTTW